jgi:HK97 family phage major capsid protein
MWSRLTNRAKKQAVWFINTELDPQLDTLNIAVSTAGGQLVYMPPGGLSDLPYGRLKGRPVIPIEQCSALGDLGDIILCDLSQYLLATKGGVQTAESMHVQFLTDQMTFRFIMRVDGQTARNSPMTPYKGSNTVSAFVTLQAR